MTLPIGVSIKLDLYTLACRKLLNRLPELVAATSADSRLDYATCRKSFDQALQNIFQDSAAIDIHDGARQIGKFLEAHASVFESRNAQVASIFKELVVEIQQDSNSWSHKNDLEYFHEQGRLLAVAMFTDFAVVDNLKLMEIEGNLIIDYVSVATSDRFDIISESSRQIGTPLAYYAKRPDNDLEEQIDDVLLMRFSFDRGFADYLGLPYLFLHEYSAHIFSSDYGNERFNDGWMLHAAASFLKREWLRSAEEMGLNRKQTNIFYHYLYEQKLGRIPRIACRFAREFEDWLRYEQPGRFEQITRELAAFQPQTGEKDFWPNQFINALENEFSMNPSRLLKKIQSTSGVRELMSVLSSV